MVPSLVICVKLSLSAAAIWNTVRLDTQRRADLKEVRTIFRKLANKTDLSPQRDNARKPGI